MTIDWDKRLYDPIYARLGVPASLDMGTDGSLSLTVIDKTSGIPVGDGVEVLTIKPACDVRVSELTRLELDRSTVNELPITFNGKTWTITHNELRPSPAGESVGEVRLFLSE